MVSSSAAVRVLELLPDTRDDCTGFCSLIASQVHTGSRSCFCSLLWKLPLEVHSLLRGHTDSEWQEDSHPAPVTWLLATTTLCWVFTSWSLFVFMIRRCFKTSRETHWYLVKVSNIIFMSGFQTSRLAWAEADPLAASQTSLSSQRRIQDTTAQGHCYSLGDYYRAPRCGRYILSAEATPVNKSFCSNGKTHRRQIHIVW